MKDDVLWVPSHGEGYYYIDIALNDVTLVFRKNWYGAMKDRYQYMVGNFFRTKEEAEASAEAFREYMAGRMPDTSWRRKMATEAVPVEEE